jgi:hypothetical protein
MKAAVRLMYISLLAVLSMPPSSLAAGAPREGAPPQAGAEKGQGSQQKMKERVLEHIDAKIRILQKARSCVRAASDMAAMAVCHAQERKQMKDLRDKDRQAIQSGKG